MSYPFEGVSQLDRDLVGALMRDGYSYADACAEQLSASECAAAARHATCIEWNARYAPNGTVVYPDGTSDFVAFDVFDYYTRCRDVCAPLVPMRSAQRQHVEESIRGGSDYLSALYSYGPTQREADLVALWARAPAAFGSCMESSISRGAPWDDSVAACWNAACRGVNPGVGSGSLGGVGGALLVGAVLAGVAWWAKR